MHQALPPSRSEAGDWKGSIQLVWQKHLKEVAIRTYLQLSYQILRCLPAGRTDTSGQLGCYGSHSKPKVAECPKPIMSVLDAGKKRYLGSAKLVIYVIILRRPQSTYGKRFDLATISQTWSSRALPSQLSIENSFVLVRRGFLGCFH